MADQQAPQPAATIQLGQTRVPLHEAAAAFDTPDVNGRTPIIVIPTRPLRVRLDMLGAAAILVVIASFLFGSGGNPWIPVLALGAAVVLVVIGGLSSLLV